MPQHMKRGLMTNFAMGLMLVAVSSVLIEVSTYASRPTEVAWAQRLSSDDLTAALEDIDRYPVAFRWALMQAASPKQRGAVWNRVAQEYLTRKGSLVGPDVRSALREFMTTRTDIQHGLAGSAAIEVAARERLLALVGGDDFDELAVYAGPLTSSPESWRALPLRVRLEGFIRSLGVVRATENCDCSGAEDCSEPKSWCGPSGGCWVKFDQCHGGTDCTARCAIPPAE